MYYVRVNVRVNVEATNDKRNVTMNNTDMKIQEHIGTRVRKLNQHLTWVRTPRPILALALVLSFLLSGAPHPVAAQQNDPK
jgi:hypothetical protein